MKKIKTDPIILFSLVRNHFNVFLLIFSHNFIKYGAHFQLILVLDFFLSNWTLSVSSLGLNPLVRSIDGFLFVFPLIPCFGGLTLLLHLEDEDLQEEDSDGSSVLTERPLKPESNFLFTFIRAAFESPRWCRFLWRRFFLFSCKLAWPLSSLSESDDRWEDFSDSDELEELEEEESLEELSE